MNATTQEKRAPKPERKSHSSPAVREKAIVLDRAGVSMKGIAAQLGVNRKTIKRWFNAVERPASLSE